MGVYNFSYSSYRALLKALLASGREPTDYFCAPSREGQLILRHDIDIDIFGCERLAVEEEALGASSTWFFQPNNDYYNPLSSQCLRILRALSERHTVGLHIDPVLFSSPEQLEREISNIYTFYSGYFRLHPVFSFHRPAKYLTDASCPVEGFINAYDQRFMNDMIYMSDSNRRPFFEGERFAQATSSRRSAVLLTHPIWWHEDDMGDDELAEHLAEQAAERICRSALRGNITRFSDLGALKEPKQ